MLIQAIVVMLMGLLGLWGYRRRRQTPWLFGALICLAVGVNLSLFALEIRLPILGRLQAWRLYLFWPSFVFAGAAACFVTFGLTGLRLGRLFLAGLGLTVLGGSAFLFTLNLQSLPAMWSGKSWWLGLVSLVGLLLLVPITLELRYVGSQKRDHRH